MDAGTKLDGLGDYHSRQISLPYGKLSVALRGDHIVAEFIDILNKYIDRTYAAVEQETVTA